MKDYNEYWFGFVGIIIVLLCIGLVLIDERLGIYLPFVLGIILSGFSGYKIYKYKRVQKWDDTNANIESFEIVERISPSEYGKEVCFYPKVKYFFDVNGSKITSYNLSLDVKDIFRK